MCYQERKVRLDGGPEMISVIRTFYFYCLSFFFSLWDETSNMELCHLGNFSL